jgi:hypothetical protein
VYIGAGGWVESKWPISCTFTAKATSSTIKIFASLNQGLTDEWFGIDKIDPLYETSCVAQPSSSCSGFRSVDMASDGKKVIAVGPIGIFQSLDGGVTWSKKNRLSDFKPKGNNVINNFDGDFVHVTCDNTCSKVVITTQQQGAVNHGNYIFDWFESGDCQACT